MQHPVSIDLRRTFVCLVLLLAFGIAAAQGLSGVFVGDSPNGHVELQLQQAGDGLTGVLTAAGASFELEGWVVDGVGTGYAYDDQGAVGFEAYLQGDTLGLYLFQVDAADQPIPDSVIELILTRRAGSAGGAGGPGLRSPGAPPAAPPTVPPARDPFVAPAAPTGDPLVGVFADARLTLTIEATGPGAYRGAIVSEAGEFPLDVVASRDGLVGSFVSGGQSYAFDAVLEGDTMVFRTAGNVYRLARVGPSGPVDPFGAPGPRSPAAQEALPSSPIIARGAHAELREDDAIAFIEALEFVLGQVGYPYQFSPAERTELLTAIAQNFPQGSETDQAVMAQARQIWTNVQANWSRASAADQREFALGVLILAFGEATVQQWVGPGGGGGGGQALGGGGTCQTFEDCTSSFVDQETWTDTFNAQGCWGAAGCTGYDAGSNSFTYDTPNYD